MTTLIHNIPAAGIDVITADAGVDITALHAQPAALAIYAHAGIPAADVKAIRQGSPARRARALFRASWALCLVGLELIVVTTTDGFALRLLPASPTMARIARPILVDALAGAGGSDLLDALADAGGSDLLEAGPAGIDTLPAPVLLDLCARLDVCA